MFFLGGLRDDIRHDVLALEPDSLHQAKKLAKIFKTKNQAKRWFSPILPHHHQPSTFSRPPISPITTQHQLHPSPSLHPNALFKHLTPAEVQEKNQKKRVFSLHPRSQM